MTSEPELLNSKIVGHQLVFIYNSKISSKTFIYIYGSYLRVVPRQISHDLLYLHTKFRIILHYIFLNIISTLLLLQLAIYF